MVRKTQDPVRLFSESNLSHDGRGVIKHQDKVYFVDGVLAGEEVVFTPFNKIRGQFTGRLETVITPSAERVSPPCDYFGVCGGCRLQHLAPIAQIQFKAQTLEQNLQRIGKVTPDHWLEPVQDALWHYRRKARPGVKFVPKKGGIIIGFREKASRYIASLQACLTLDKPLSDLLPSLHQLFAKISIFDQIPQLEVVRADNTVAVIVRHVAPFSEADISRLHIYAQTHKLQLFLQSGSPQTIKALYPHEPEPLYYALPDYNLKLYFLAQDFLQVNARVNQKMIALALEQLALLPDDTVLDLFCGLGNFSLPMAVSGAKVLGIEGNLGLVERARENARSNQLKQIQFDCVDLHQPGVESTLPASSFNKLLLDPPRSGAQLIVTDYVPILKPDLIVYVSCNPATLARDAHILVHQHGYTLESAGAIDMFPHTAHVESIAIFRLS